MTMYLVSAYETSSPGSDYITFGVISGQITLIK